MMEYFYKNAGDLPGTPLESINSAAKRLHAKLVSLEVDSLDISEYSKRYLGKKAKNPVGVLQLYSHILALSLQGLKRPLREITLVDYGGGTGVLSLLAKETGIGHVIYNDIYDVSCGDVLETARALGTTIDDVVCGDIDDLIARVRSDKISIDAMASYDVIEHIYDIEDYLRKLSQLTQPPTRIVFGSGANMRNPLVARQIGKIHAQCEFEDRSRERGTKERDSLQSYLSLRKDIIKRYNEQLSDAEVDKLAKLTRGQIATDIRKSVDEFVDKGRISYAPDHPTNTCDPNTGNWAEHLMDTAWLAEILEDEGFRVKILNGYYPSTGVGLRKSLKHLLNHGIRTLRQSGCTIAPYYIVYADQQTSSLDSRHAALS